jgi:hypothetical protein
VPTCDDHAANGEESDVDCGGSCTDCEIGKACADNNDCVGNLCAGGLCTTEACTNGGQDGSETDVDCGGRQCPPCDLGQTCLGGRDCTTRQCFGGVCSDHSCTDNLHNGAETDIDCGGTDCPGCADGKACLLDGDCANGTCVANLCISCVDGLLNGDETGQDCGGSCPGCAPGQPCDFDADCASNICDSLFQCTSPTCEDSVSNGTESDTDCGGSCPPCALNDRCNDEADCATATCTDGVCAIPSCTDGAQNGDETDIDCGGGTCTGCGDGRQCTADGDCLSSPCLSGTCGDCAAFGTDSFGYVGCASTPPTLPCPDISSTGTNLSLSDDGYQSVSIGFAFDFYGTNYNDATIGSNGLLYFEATSHRFSNVCLPTTTTPAAFVAVFWDDLNPGASPGAVYYESRGTAPNRAFIVQWQVLHYSSSPESIDVRAVLRESSNHIEVCYVDTSFGTATFDQGLSATLGVQGSSTDALTYSCNEARAQAGLLVEYRHP